MSAEERLQAQEKTGCRHAEHCQLNNVRQTRKHEFFGVRSEGVVDTRLLGEPKASTVRQTTRDSSSSRSWATLVQLISRLKQGMIESEVLQVNAIMNSAWPERATLAGTCNAMVAELAQTRGRICVRGSGTDLQR